MSLPPGWAEATLGDVVEPIETGDPSKHPNEHFTYVDIGSIDNKALAVVDPKRLLGRDAPSRARRRVRAGDVLFSTVRPYLKNIAMVPGELDGQFTSTGICVLRASQDVEPSYLFRCVTAQDFVDAMTLSSDGTMYPAIADKDVFGQRIAFPPAAEQRRIVSKLDALTARLARARAEAERSVELARRLRDQIQARGIGIGTILLSELLSAPLRNGLSIKGTDSPPGIPALKLSALRSQSVDLHDVRYLDLETPRAESYRLECDDVLVARGNGTLRLVGRASRVAVAPNDLTIFPDTAFRIRLNPSRASARWFTLIWNSPLVRAQIEARARTTAGIWKISQRDLNEIELPDVAPSDQVEWVASVEAAFARADRLEAEAKKALALIDRLEAAILAKAFRGELVAQDPNDEPASVLLERIRARRAAEPKAKRGRRPKLAS